MSNNFYAPTSEQVAISLNNLQTDWGDVSYNWVIDAPKSVTSESLAGSMNDVLNRVSELYGRIDVVEQSQFGSEPRFQLTMSKGSSTVPIHITAVSRADGSPVSDETGHNAS